MVHLRFCSLTAANYANKNPSRPAETRHPQVVMKELGITYELAVSQSISDSWKFWNCQNVPTDLPDFLTVQDWNPVEHIGFGLSEDDAKALGGSHADIGESQTGVVNSNPQIEVDGISLLLKSNSLSFPEGFGEGR